MKMINTLVNNNRYKTFRLTMPLKSRASYFGKKKAEVM